MLYNLDLKIIIYYLNIIVQAGVDTVALNAELKSIIKSGILDLGVLGLWSKDDIEAPAQLRHSGPR